MMAVMADRMEAPDTVLVGQATAGDRAAFALLVARHYDFIFRVAWRWSGRRPDAEDIAQEVCVRLGRAIGTFRGQGAFTTWLYALTLNVARDTARKNARERAKAEAFHGYALTVEGPAADAEEEAETLWAAVRQLPNKQRQAVLLVYGEGLSHAAAADVLACAEATVSWHLHEARKRLKLLMSAAGEA